MIVNKKMDLQDIVDNGKKCYPDMVKFCIDKKRRIIAIDEDMHIDMEHELYDNGSDYNDIFGGNIMLDEENPYFEWEAHPNIERNHLLGTGIGREITDESLINELKDIVTENINIRGLKK